MLSVVTELETEGCGCSGDGQEPQQSEWAFIKEMSPELELEGEREGGAPRNEEAGGKYSLYMIRRAV